MIETLFALAGTTKKATENAPDFLWAALLAVALPILTGTILLLTGAAIGYLFGLLRDQGKAKIGRTGLTPPIHLVVIGCESAHRAENIRPPMLIGAVLRPSPSKGVAPTVSFISNAPQLVSNRQGASYGTEFAT